MEFLVVCCLIEWLKSMKKDSFDKSQIIFNERRYHIVRIEDCHRHGCYMLVIAVKFARCILQCLQIFETQKQSY